VSAAAAARRAASSCAAFCLELLVRAAEAGEDRRVRVVLHADDRRLDRRVAGRCRAHRVESGVGGRVHEGVDHDTVALRGQVVDALLGGCHGLVGVRLLVLAGGQLRAGGLQIRELEVALPSSADIDTGM
jgi:hypothetical protein